MLLVPTRLCIIVCVYMVPRFYKNQRLTVPEISSKFNINPRTLTPALTRLVRAGILNSRTGGNDRGYILARDPKNISMYDIAHNIQGDLQMRSCSDVIGDCSACFINGGGKCKLFTQLNSALLHVREELEKISLYDQYTEGVEGYSNTFGEY